MTAVQPRLSRDELARLGTLAHERLVRTALRPEDNGKFVAIDVESGTYEVDENDYTAVTRLHARVPDAQVWLIRAGHPTAHRVRGVA